jgi:hypothetical protein
MGKYDLTPTPAEQPKNHPGSGAPRWIAGAQRSVGRLKYLGYDPIGELVKKYKELDVELAHQQKLRSGEIVELNAYGKPRNFNPQVLMEIYDKQINIAEKLLRYRYGRVPEGELPNYDRPSSLIVNLTKKGESYVVNNDTESVMDIDKFEQDYEEDK